MVLENLSTAHRRLGHLDLARDLHTRGLAMGGVHVAESPELFAGIGDEGRGAHARNILGVVLRGLGRVPEALRSTRPPWSRPFASAGSTWRTASGSTWRSRTAPAGPSGRPRPHPRTP